MPPTVQQQAVIDWFAKPQMTDIPKTAPIQERNLVVRARAGCGKTKTIVDGVNVAPDTHILLAAFNKSIANELQDRITNPRAEVMTLHSLGYRLIKRFWPNVRIEEKRKGVVGRADWLTNQVLPANAPFIVKRTVTKLHSKAREVAPYATADELKALAEEWNMVLPDNPWELAGWQGEDPAVYAAEAMRLAKQGEEPPITGIDFADMLFLPVTLGLGVPMYDLVVVDEAQDMNTAQLDMALMMRKPQTGRLCLVGDDRQAIYGFRGADTDGLDRLKSVLKARELPLTVTFRCAQNVVREARTMVPDFQAHVSNPLGTVRHVDAKVMVKEAQPGDFILSRANAPLASVALALVRQGVKVRIAGRDFGFGLTNLARDLAKGAAANSLPQFLAKLKGWEQKEADRAMQADSESRLAQVMDQALTLRALAEGAAGVPEVMSRIERLFGDEPVVPGMVEPAVVCSSVHRAKGLERERVWVLRETLMMPPRCQNCHHRHPDYPCAKCGCEDYEMDMKELREEQNIFYVAVTRAKNELVYVDKLDTLTTPTR